VRRIVATLEALLLREGFFAEVRAGVELLVTALELQQTGEVEVAEEREVAGERALVRRDGAAAIFGSVRDQRVASGRSGGWEDLLHSRCEPTAERQPFAILIQVVHASAEG